MEKKNVFFLFSNISGNNSKKESNFCANSINNGHFKKGFTNTLYCLPLVTKKEALAQKNH